MRRLFAGGTAAAFVISAVLHLAGWFGSGYVRIGFWEPGGGTGGDQAEVEMAILPESAVLGLESEGSQLAQPLVQEVSALPAGMVSVDEGPPGPSGLGTGDGPSVIEDAGGGGDIGSLPGSGLGGAGGGGAKFFGIEATGSRFAYVVDVSGSMEGPRLERLRAELTSSVAELQEAAQFVIIPFASAAAPLGDRNAWTEASPTGKRWARNTIAAELARGRDGTVPLPGFQIAFSVRPRPDAIYFMTDGEQFPSGTLEELAALNGQFKVPVHCIRFGDADVQGAHQNGAEQVMKTIAKQSKGTYTFIAIK
ncbi:MAG: vWA domain-containing protein [Phycisphaerales bacterium]